MEERSHVKYFEGFNALRFIAAMLVVLHHAEQIRMNQGLPSLKAYTLFNNGGLAVDFFFVLSGFLITYLLLRERQVTSTISIKQFYKRRILRIWPLYYLLVVLGLLVLPIVLRGMGQDYELPFRPEVGWFFYLFFLPNAVSSMFPVAGNLLYPLWSIGVEEQFYIVWAPLFKFLYKYVTVILLLIIIGKMLLNGYMTQLVVEDDSWFVWRKFIRSVKFESMSVGGLGAIYLFRVGVERVQRLFIFNRGSQVVILLFILLHITARNHIYTLDYGLSAMYSSMVKSEAGRVFVSILFCWLLLNTSINKASLFKLRNRTLNRLGEFSYGIYMYHIMVIFAFLTLFGSWLPSGFVLSELVFYGFMIPLLLAISFISFRYFESYFLKRKS